MVPKIVFNEAIKIAKTSTCDYRVGAVLFKGSNIKNSTPNSSKVIGYRKDCFIWEPTRHAEINVIHGIKREVLRECDLFVLRLTRADEIVCARPCKPCIKALIKAGFSKVFFTNWKGQIERLNLHEVDLKGYRKYPDIY